MPHSLYHCHSDSKDDKAKARVGRPGRACVINLIKLFFVLVLLALGAGFASLNEGQVTLNYYFGLIEMPMPMALLGSLGLGLLLGFLAGLSLWAKARREIGSLRRSARLVQEEVKNLRALPLKQQ
jgi:putative membrane protein